MNRVHVLVPLGLMAAFVAYYQLSPPLDRDLRFVGEPPDLPRKTGEAAEWQKVRFVSGDEYEERDGAQEAKDDLRRGRLVLLAYGFDLPWAEEAAEIWKEDYGVEEEVIAGCLVSEPLVKYATDYNRVMGERIAARFGAEIFDSVNRRAKEFYDRRGLEKAAVGSGKRRTETTP